MAEGQGEEGEHERGDEACTWCGKAVPDDDGFRLRDAGGKRRAVFCRLEHTVPWLIKGPKWETAGDSAPGAVGGESGEPCSWCGEQPGPDRLLLTRHRGELRILDAFCDSEHLGSWAKAGGRYR